MTGIDWAAVYAEHHGRVFRVVSRRVSGDRRLAEDLTQDAFVRAIRAERQWTDDGRGIGPWLTRIAVNLCIDHFKSHRVRREVPTEDVVDIDRQVVGSPEDRVIDSCAHAHVRHALAALTPRHTEALFLQYWEDWPDERIADRFGCRVGAVKTLKTRARHALAQRLEAAA